MTTFIKAVLITALLSAMATPLWAQGVYNAASCNESDVNAVINGPTHIAVNGDTIIIPTGTCTWTSNLSISVGITLTGSGTPNTGPSSFGSGTLNTVIVDNAGSSGPLVKVSGITHGETFTLSLLDIEPNSSGTALWSPVSIAGTCTASGCANIRVDNIGFGLATQWNENGNSSNADWMIRTDNLFGVIDHCTLPNNSSVELFNANHSAYLGVGGYGDNSWARPDSFGTGNALYAENNVVYSTQAMNDCDTSPAGGAVGGCRIADRYNHFTFEPGAFALTIVHGLDTDGRPRSGRQQEVYGNSITCPSGGLSCPSIVGVRGGTSITFGNSATVPGGTSIGSFDSITIYRNVFNAAPFSYCGGLNSLDPFDTNDNTVYYSGTMAASGGLTMTDGTKSWTPNQFAPPGAPYSVYDTTQGFVSEVVSNTSTTITVQGPISESGWSGFNNGDSYQIMRATVCADQAGRGQGNYISGATPSPSGALSQTLDPIYEWNDSASPDKPPANVSPNLTARVIAYRDWYSDNSLGTPHAQTSPTSPFSCNGSTGGVGWGTLALRPSSCTGACAANTPGCGYFATDQGPQGTLYVWSAGAWIVYYAPYTYPHPLTQGGPPGPPTNLQAIPQ
ncbi:MAG: hypothetical protein WCC92_21135 [Candidatus Korobacteraceae bacterium]